MRVIGQFFPLPDIRSAAVFHITMTAETQYQGFIARCRTLINGVPDFTIILANQVHEYRIFQSPWSYRSVHFSYSQAAPFPIITIEQQFKCAYRIESFTWLETNTRRLL